MLSSPSLIEYNGFKFLVFDSPTDDNLDGYLKELVSYNVKYLVRLESGYSSDKVKESGIEVFDFPFPDGSAPPQSVVSQWLQVVNTMVTRKDGIIGIHCIAGLGRAPVLVAVALIELGASYENAVEIIRNQRKGAINAKQLKYLKHYKPQKGQCCTIL